MRDIVRNTEHVLHDLSDPVEHGIQIFRQLVEVIIRAGRKVAAPRGDNAGGDRATETKRITDCQHPIPDTYRVCGGNVDIGKGGVLLYAQQSQVGTAVDAD